MNIKIKIAFVCLLAAQLGYAAQEADPKIAQKVAQRKAAEQEVAGSEVF